MTGSVHDAEDLVQETLLAAWRGLEQFQGRATVRRARPRLPVPASLSGSNPIRMSCSAAGQITRRKPRLAMRHTKRSSSRSRRLCSCRRHSSGRYSCCVMSWPSPCPRSRRDAGRRRSVGEQGAAARTAGSGTRSADREAARGPAASVGGALERFRLVPVRANGQPAFGCYLKDPHVPVARAYGLIVLALRGDRVAAITGFADTSVFGPFGLPAHPPGAVK